MKKMAAGSFKANVLQSWMRFSANAKPCHYETWQAGCETRPAEYGEGQDYNFLAGKGSTTGDVVSPAISPEEWGELKPGYLNGYKLRICPT